MDNRTLVDEYINYLLNVRQNDPATIRCRRHELQHMLDWINENSLENIPKLVPAFPLYLLTARRDGKNKILSPKTLSKITETTRSFLEWVKLEYPDCYGNISQNWIMSIRPNRANNLHSEVKRNIHWSLTDVQKIASLKLCNISDIRNRAAICFLYLSGMRITAFVSLPIKCVDLDHSRIEQLPSEGVKTKNHKAAITSLLPIPNLFNIVKEWDERIRSELPLSALWYAKLSDNGRQKYESRLIDGIYSDYGRRTALIKGMHRLCKMADVPFLSPHKLRHGHAIYGIKHARNIKELKAVSQNLMHDSISVTDGIYGNLNEDDICSTLAGFIDDLNPGKDDNSKTQDLVTAMIMLQQNPELLKRLIEA